MSELIERDDKEDANLEVIGPGDSRSLVSLKVYQDIYHQLTGRTEQIRKRYSDSLLLEFSEIEQLHYKIKQLCDVHKIVACNEAITIFHEKERKEQFTSFERFTAYNANAASPTLNIELKYNFSIIPAELKRPQEYVLSLRLTSRVAMIKQIQDDAPAFVRGQIYGLINMTTAVAAIDYADYVIARGFLEAFDEWVRGCKKTPPILWLAFLRRWSHLMPNIFRFLSGSLIFWYAYQAVPTYFSTITNEVVRARFFVVFGGGAFLLITLIGAVGAVIEDAIDCYPVLSYLKLNKGDGNLIDEFVRHRKSVLFRFFVACALTIILGIISTKLERFI